MAFHQIPNRRYYTVCCPCSRPPRFPRHRKVNIMTKVLSTAFTYLYVSRIMESTLRTTNNLLERLHASFFFYILTGTETFLKIGSFLPSAVLISVAMMFGGLRQWVDAGWIRRSEIEKQGETLWEQRRRPMLHSLSLLISTHLLGIIIFWVVQTSWFIENRKVCHMYPFLCPM
jgi:GPI-anchor transamidase subunit GAA1